MSDARRAWPLCLESSRSGWELLAPSGDFIQDAELLPHLEGFPETRRICADLKTADNVAYIK